MADTLAWTTAPPGAPACPTCYFGATAATLHSFPYEVLGGIQEEVIIYTSRCEDGSISSWSTTITLLPPGLTTLPPNVKIFDSIEEMTWDIEGVCASYPTTYAQFLGFERDSFDLETSFAVPTDVCLGYKCTAPIALPASTTPASFIYPAPTISYSTADATEYIYVPIPTALINYLESCEGEGLQDIASCLPLDTWYTNGPPKTTTSATDCLANELRRTSTSSSTSTDTLQGCVTKNPPNSTTYPAPITESSSTTSGSTTPPTISTTNSSSSRTLQSTTTSQPISTTIPSTSQSLSTTTTTSFNATIWVTLTETIRR